MKQAGWWWRALVLGSGMLSSISWGSAAQAASRKPGDVSFLTGPQSGAPLDLALEYLRAHREHYGLSESDIADVAVPRQSTSAVTGITRIVLTQRYRGIEVWNGVISINVARNGSIVNLGNGFVSNLAKSVAEQVASISATEAVVSAAAHLELKAPESLQTLRPAVGPDQDTLLSDGGIARQDIPVKLVIEPQAKGGPRLAWNVNIDVKGQDHWWNARVDAQTGELLSKNDWVVRDEFPARQPGPASDAPSTVLPGYVTPNPVLDGSSYQVYAIPDESPIHATPVPPAEGRTTVNQPADALASPYGWQDTNGAVGAEFTITQGNNVQAYTDTDFNNVPDPGSSPDGGAGLDFLFPIDHTLAPSAYRPAAVTNLFYWNNLMHDVNYLYGFNEAATNFQVNNYGRGGTGNDSVQAEAQDGGGTNNANFATPAEGSRPRMQMYLWTAPTPDRDGDLDNGIITHEYGHGISNRLHPTVSCLGNAEQMGEGWSDWMGLILTMKAGDTGPQGRGIGTYALNQPTTGLGIRPARYSTDLALNSYTYANLPSMAVPHGVGFIWATMLWEMNWALIDAHGFEPNIYNTSSPAGNILAHKLVMAGMDLDPCNPGFVDGRNAILAADTALTGGANQCVIWGAFAKRGLGFSAAQGSSSSAADGTAAFDLPPSCTFGNGTPPTQNVCAGTNAIYTVNVGPAFNTPPHAPPVTLAATGNPPASTLGFSLNPVPSVPNTSTLTIGTAGVSTSSSTIALTGTTSGGGTQSMGSVGLNVFSAAPASAPTLTAPANGATGQPTGPTFTWSAVAGTASYVLEVDDDSAFGSINFTTTVAGTTANGSGLSALTTYYWRVRPTNPCGSGSNSAVFSFTTGACISPNLPIPDNNPTGATSVLVVPSGYAISDLNVSIDATHTWVGDLAFTLTNTTTATSVVVIDRPGVPASAFGCSNNNVGVVMDDEGGDGPVESQCQVASPALFGSPTPNNPLTTFDGQALAGTWSLKVVDAAGGDTGTLTQWCLLATSDVIFKDGFQ